MLDIGKLAKKIHQHIVFNFSTEPEQNELYEILCSRLYKSERLTSEPRIIPNLGGTHYEGSGDDTRIFIKIEDNFYSLLGHRKDGTSRPSFDSITGPWHVDKREYECGIHAVQKLESITHWGL